MMKVVLYILFAVICWGSLFFDTQYINDSPIVPRMLWAEIGACIFALLFMLFAFLKKGNRLNPKVMYAILLIFAFEQACYGVLQFCGLVNSVSYFRVVGNFDNPAGLSVCLCCCLPFCYPVFIHSNSFKRYLSIFVFCVLIIANFMTQSQAGMLSMLFVCVCMVSERIKIKSWCLLAIFSIVIGLGYLYKKDSANGRLLIWRCSLEMVKEKPITGWGPNAFRTNYMNYQASFLKNNPNHPFALLADNVKHPFNEYLNIILMGGFLGFALFLAFLSFMFFCYYRSRSSVIAKTALWSMVGICIFAFFSYPSRYPFIWIVFIIDCIILISQANFRICLNNTVKAIALIIAVPLVCYCLFNRISEASFQCKWKEISDKAISGKYENVFCEYDGLSTQGMSNPYFLYNYAAELFFANRFENSLMILLQCKDILADYELEMLLGETYSDLGQSSNAINHYQNASYMCPSRLEPLYKIFQIGKDVDSTKEVIDLAQSILSRKTKFISRETSDMRMELKRYILIHQRTSKKVLTNSIKPMDKE